MTTHHRFGRREALVGMGAAAIGGAAIGSAAGVPGLLSRGAVRSGGTDTQTAATEASTSTRLAAPSDDVRALFGPLADGSAISTHWRLETVHAVRAGAVPVVMSTIYGGRFAVEIFRADAGGPPPIARAGDLALHLVNHGDGSSQTAELAGLGVIALGRELHTRIIAGAPLPAALETYRERTARDPLGAFDIPLV